MESTGEKIRRLRKERGWTQEELARRSGVKGGIVSAYETGTRLWTRKTLLPIATALEVNLRDLVSREGRALDLAELIDSALEDYGDQLPSDPKTVERIKRYLELIKLELSQQ